MKKILSISILIILSCPAQADQSTNAPATSALPPASWKTLDQQAQDFAVAVQSQDVHALHKIDHAVADETAGLQKTEPTLPDDQKQKLDSLLADIAKQATRAHLDGHAANWDDAAAAQKQFAADVKEAEALLPHAG